MYIFNALPTSFPGFSPTCPTERERETLGKNPGNEVTRRHLIPSTKLTSSSHKTFHFSYMKVLDEMFKVSSIFKEKNKSG